MCTSKQYCMKLKSQRWCYNVSCVAVCLLIKFNKRFLQTFLQCLSLFLYFRPFVTLWPETEAFREALLLPPEPKGANRGKERGFRPKCLQEYTWGGLLKKVYESKMGILNCCGKIFNSASSAREHIYRMHRDEGSNTYRAPDALIGTFAEQEEEEEEKEQEKEQEEDSTLTTILRACSQESPVKFCDFLDESLVCTKIGEGASGEVFEVEFTDGRSAVLKIIPVEGKFPVYGSKQKTLEEILPEIVISKELSLLGDVQKNDIAPTDNMTTAFLTLHRVRCCQDAYPGQLIKEWDQWQEKHGTDNDRPDIFPSDQIFIVFENNNCGIALEKFELRSMSEAWSTLEQTALALAVAENTLEFEHRDLHWGNILVERTEEAFIVGTLDGRRKVVETHGVRATIIDFTHSRIKKDGVTLFNNLALDKELFTGSGDYQFKVYRLMQEANKDNWKPFEPRTNVLWLHYLSIKLLEAKKNRRKNRNVKNKLEEFKSSGTDFTSATQVVEQFFLPERP
ncbi:serine/threonine-protein kinase haspin-like [Oculina patagonica]